MKTADELQQLADLCEERGDYPKAARLHGKALQAAERSYGKQSSELVSYLYNFGMIALTLGDNESAQKSFERLLETLSTFGGSSADLEEVHQLLDSLTTGTLAANA